MRKNTGRGSAALGAALAVVCGAAVGIAIYKNREWLKSFTQELTGEAPPEPPQPEEVNIVIDCSGGEE